MKDRKFKKLWQEQMYPALQGLKKERNKAKLWYVLALIAFVATAFILLSFMEGMPSIPFWVLLVAGGVVVTCVVFMIRMDVSYVSKFKQAVFRVVNDVADFDWSINSGQTGIDGSRLLKESRLYHGYDEVISDDELTAHSADTNITVREVDARAKVRKSEEEQAVRHVFKGFIAKIAVSESFEAETYVQTESDGRFFDSGAGGFFDTRDDIRETELEWGEFERFLVVKSTDPAKARRIFTPDFMAVLYDWWQNNNREFRISFKDKAVYIGFPTRVTLEPKILGGLDEERDPVRNILEFILMLEELSQLLIEKQQS